MKWLGQKWTLLGLLTGGWLVFTTVWAINFVVVPPGSTQSFEITKFVFTSISAFGVLFTALSASFNALEASRTTQARMEFDRVENTFSYFQRWDSPSLREARDVTRSIDKLADDLSQNALLERVRTDPNVERSVITMFNFFEEIYLSIKAARVKNDLLKEGFGELYISIYRRFEKWVANHVQPKQQANLAALLREWS